MPVQPAPASEFSALVDRYSATVDERLLKVIRAEEQVPNLHEGLVYALGLDLEDRAARGKRIRPVLCLMTCEALGGDPARALGFACAIELMHNFALVHDDIEDGDTVRRNRPCTHLAFGLAHGVNIGDYLMCKVVSTLAFDGALDDSTRLELLRLMSDTLDHTHVGQCLDINARGNRQFTKQDYYRLAREKTGFYLAAPMIGGAVAAGADHRVREALSRFGHAAGPMFQITDDLLDLTTGKGRGGAIGSDVREGKRSFLVAEAADRASEAERTRLYDILDTPREDNGDEDIAWVLGLFNRLGVLESARIKCRVLLEEGLRALEDVPAPLASLLAAFAHSMVDRKR